ncbi:MAG: adenylate/guanylate cyclase domain-containing protein [Aeoliella sp.]
MNYVVPHQPRPTLVPLMPAEQVDFLNDPATGPGPSSETITRWLAEAGRLHRSTAGSPEYYADAARFAVEVVGLDAAWVLMRQESAWEIVGSHPQSPTNTDYPDSQPLDYLDEQLVTWYQPRSAEEELTFADTPQAVVVAPVLDFEGKLVAAIYGMRNTAGENRRLGVRTLEARLVQLLAESVSVGIVRMDRETEAARTQVLLEQAFSPTVADYIRQHPESLTGQLCEVTLLFADLQGFTSIAELLSPADCYELLGNVMELLSEIVESWQGVVVDYYGDGLLAQWNAPVQQSGHATLACSAAQEMLDCLPTTSDQWRYRLNGPLQLGVGIHTGEALVGNAGTPSRIKYGPRGNAVNVASRVQTAGKQLGLPLVMTRATETKLSDDYFGLRVCTAKLLGLEQELDLYTAYPASNLMQLQQHLDRYADALEWFEAGNLATAERLLDDLVTKGNVTPAQFLARQTAIQMQAAQSRRAVDKSAVSIGPVIEFSAK